MLILPSYVVLFLPLLVAFFSGWFCHERLSGAFNVLISLVIIIGVAYLYTRITGPLIGSQTTSIVIITAYCSGLIAWPLTPLQRWFVLHMTSPFAALATFKIRVEREGGSGYQQPVQWQPTHEADTTPEIPTPPQRLPSKPLQQSIILNHQERMQP